MLIGDRNNDGVRHNDKEGLWAVREGTLQWASWAYWYDHEFDRKHFPQWMTVLSEWPPTTQEGANAVAKWLSDIRDSKFQKELSPIGGDPVPANPRPWNGGKRKLPEPPGAPT